MLCSYFSDERRLFFYFVQNLFQNFNNYNYDHNSSQISCQQTMRLFLNTWVNSHIIILKDVALLDRLDLD